MLSIFATIRPLLTLIILATLTGNAIATGVEDLDFSNQCHLACVLNTGSLRLMAGEELGREYVLAIQDCPSMCVDQVYLHNEL